MKQIYLHILATVVVPLALAGCGNEDTEPDSVNVAPVFKTAIEGGQSRVVDNQWEPGDEIGISTSFTGASASNLVYNVCHVISNSGNEVNVKNIEEKIYYKSNSRTGQVTFNAYYPYINIDDPTVTANRSITISTTDQTKQHSFDFLFATAKGSKDSPTVELEFTHKMSMVTFVFKNGNDFNVSDIVSYNLGGLYMNAKFSITTGSFATFTNISSAGMDLTSVKDGKPVTPLILIPQSVPGSKPVPLEIIDCNGVIYKVDLTFPSNKLVAGENYKFTITVSKTGVTVSNCTIEDWTTEEDTGWGTGTADSADDPEE